MTIKYVSDMTKTALLASATTLSTFVLFQECARSAAIGPLNVDIGTVNKIFELYTNGIFPLAGGMGTESTLNALKGDTWTVNVKNTSEKDWTDFHIEFRGDKGVNAINMIFDNDPKATAGFGATANKPLAFKLKNRSTEADLLPPTVTEVVKPGATVSLVIETKNASPFLGAVYHLGIKATDTAKVPVPEPLTIFGSAMAIACGAVFKRKPTNKN